MFVYLSNFDEFSDIVQRNQIANVLQTQISDKLGMNVSPSEVNSWHNSLVFMRNALDLAGTPGDSGIAVEFQIPLTSKRVDVLVSGIGPAGTKNVVLVELKQWSSAEKSDKEDLVKTVLGGSLVETTHPSYQAWSYATFIADYNEAVQTKHIQLQPCSYLHNAVDPHVFKDSQYSTALQKAPLFLRDEVDELGEFISSFVHKGDHGEALYEIEKGRIRPSKALIEYLDSLLKGNDEFILLDEQKVAAETILVLDKVAQFGKRQVLIVEAGPGTGKSVLAINLLGRLTANHRVAQYVTRNTAPRQVFEFKLTGSYRQSRIRNLFKSAGSYINARPRSIDVLLVDEAHRLSPKSGPNGNLGENQVKEVINASNLAVFFLDEAQQVLLKDIGSRREIEHWAEHYEADVTHIELESQFRCNGSDSYIAWLDHILQVRSSANLNFRDINYDFRVFDSPVELYDDIEAIDKTQHSARVVAGYCWEWVSRRDPNLYDIHIDEHDFRKRWNLSDDGNFWIIKSESISEIGCIHTCQGLELDYVGVIVGDDFVVRDGAIVTNPDARAKGDQTIRGYKTQLAREPEKTLEALDHIIKNTYRTLMTRGMKGCYVYCVDRETNEYFKRQLARMMN
ncbi:MAG: DUF2075 domain-containing protein [Gammaproteobacteria bacterium]|nr:DUF2075 domain-containing protein [Gammaproteobacteria bacterium]